jgi:CheY-like chemotaxis protein
MSSQPPSPAPERKPGVLIVDDDPVLLELLKEVLATCGFEVWAASAGEEAVRLYREHKAVIDVALLDVHMTGVDGPQALFKLQRVNPEVRAFFMSGIATDSEWERLRGLGAIQFVSKPFNSADLSRKLWLAARGIPIPN